MIFAALSYTLEKGSQVGRLYISNNRGARGGTRLTGKREASEGRRRRRRRRKYRGQPVIFVWDSSILRAPPIKRPRAKLSRNLRFFFPPSVYISQKFPANMHSNKHSHNGFPLWIFFDARYVLWIELSAACRGRPPRSCSIFPLYSGSRIASRFIYYIILYQHARARTHE